MQSTGKFHERDPSAFDGPDSKRARLSEEYSGVPPEGLALLDPAGVSQPPEVNLSASNVYVHGLPKDYNEQMLSAMFAPFGEIESMRLVRDTITSQSRGFGFVKYRTHEQAEEAIAILNNRVINKHPITVKYANPTSQPHPNRVPGSAPTPVAEKARPASKNDNLYVKNLPPTTTEDQLRIQFGAYGHIASLRVLLDNLTGLPRGTAMIRFGDSESAERAIIGLNGQVLPGGTAPLIVKFADTESDKIKRKLDNVKAQLPVKPTNMPVVIYANKAQQGQQQPIYQPQGLSMQMQQPIQMQQPVQQQRMTTQWPGQPQHFAMIPDQQSEQFGQPYGFGVQSMYANAQPQPMYGGTPQTAFSVQHSGVQQPVLHPGPHVPGQLPVQQPFIPQAGVQYPTYAAQGLQQGLGMR